MIHFQVSASNFSNPSRAEIFNKAARQAARRMGFANAVIQFFFSIDKNCVAFRIISNGRVVAVRYHDVADRRGVFGAFKA